MLADALSQRQNREPSWTVGVVQSVESNTATVLWRGEAISNVHWLVPFGVTTAAPVAGNVVYMIQGSGQLFILGKVS